MKERYKYEFMKYIYNKLNFDVIESQIVDYGISSVECDIEGLYTDVSKYFSLVNDVDETRLSPDMKKKYEHYFSMSKEEILENNLQDEVSDFLEASYKYLLYPNVTENFYFYGSFNHKYMAPRDSIVLGFNYCEFALDNDNFDELYLKQDGFVCDILNHIQEDIAVKNGFNIAVLKYNEYSTKKVSKGV